MNKEQIPLPCPACGKSASVFIYDYQVTYAVMCNSCGMKGPQTFIREVELSEMIDEAVTAWNILPRTPIWTNEPPKIEGYYWVRHRALKNSVIDLVYKRYGSLMYVFNGQEVNINTLDCLVWAGPISLPKENIHD